MMSKRSPAAVAAAAAVIVEPASPKKKAKVSEKHSINVLQIVLPPCSIKLDDQWARFFKDFLMAVST